MPHLTLGDKILDGARHLLDRHIGIDPVLIEEVNRVDPQALQRLFGDLPDALGPAVESAAAAGAEIEAELRGDDHAALEWLKSLADQALIRERPVDFGRVKESHATFDRRPDERYHLAPVGNNAAMVVHAHAAEADRRDFRLVASKFSHLHRHSPWARVEPASPAIV